MNWWFFKKSTKKSAKIMEAVKETTKEEKMENRRRELHNKMERMCSIDVNSVAEEVGADRALVEQMLGHPSKWAHLKTLIQQGSEVDLLDLLSLAVNYVDEEYRELIELHIKETFPDVHPAQFLVTKISCEELVAASWGGRQSYMAWHGGALAYLDSMGIMEESIRRHPLEVKMDDFFAVELIRWTRSPTPDKYNANWYRVAEIIGYVHDAHMARIGDSLEGLCDYFKVVGSFHSDLTTVRSGWRQSLADNVAGEILRVWKSRLEAGPVEIPQVDDPWLQAEFRKVLKRRMETEQEDEKSRVGALLKEKYPTFVNDSDW